MLFITFKIVSRFDISAILAGMLNILNTLYLYKLDLTDNFNKTFIKLEVIKDRQ